MSFYYLNVTIHVLAAMLWLGGMFFLGVVGAPLLRAIHAARERSRSASGDPGSALPARGPWMKS